MWDVRALASTHTAVSLCRLETLRGSPRYGVIQKLENNVLFRTLRARNNTLRIVIHLLLGAKRLTTSGCSRQSLRQTRLPPVLLLIRSVLGPYNIYGRYMFVRRTYCSVREPSIRI
jgi:hypothetical protein